MSTEKSDIERPITWRATGTCAEVCGKNGREMFSLQRGPVTTAGAGAGGMGVRLRRGDGKGTSAGVIGVLSDDDTNRGTLTRTVRGTLFLHHKYITKYNEK